MKQITEVLKNVKSIAISGHVRPDGDCIGACMGLYLYLNKTVPEIVTRIFLEQPAERFSCISHIEKIEDATACKEQFDMFIALDCSPDRLGAAETIYEHAGQKVNIDHHISNEGISDINEIRPNVSSTCELIYELLDEKMLDEDIAKALYIGMISDTGVFQYSNTSSRTMQIAASLMQYPFDFSKLIDETFYEKTYVQNQILGRALLESILFMDGKCIVGTVDKKTMDFYQIVPSDLEGIVSQLRYTKGVECAIFLYEADFQSYKVSMRSNGKINVSTIAQYFGGGGHIRAAGCTMNGTVYDVINNISQQIAKQIENEKV